MDSPYLLKEKEKQVGKIFGQDACEVLNIQLRAGQSVPVHSADCDVMIIVRRGIVEFTVEDQTAEVSNEQLLHIKPFEKQGLAAKEDADLIVMKIK